MLRSIRCPASIVLAGLFLTLLHLGCASLREADEGVASPTVWSAQHPDSGQVFLLGSVNLGRTRTLGTAVDWAFSDASELVLEVDPSRYGEQEVADVAERHGHAATDAGLARRIDPETHELLEFYLARRGYSAEPFEHLQPWLVATAIAVAEFRALGYSPENGVDRMLLARADGRKPVGSLQSLDSRFAELSGLPDDVQSTMLRDMLERSEHFSSEAAAVREAWRRGDEAELERLAFRHIDRPEFAAFYESFVFERNQRMADRIAALASDGRSRLVVVGIAHTLGDRGIPALLDARGFDVQKVGVR
jgi:uncharacterized protein YbaP (TraB family)